MIDDRIIAFETVTPAHLPLLSDWLKQPHVANWWGDPDPLLKRVRTRQSSRAAADGYVITVDAKEVGYIQSWDPAYLAADLWAKEWWLKDLPPRSIGIDVFLGPLHMTGQGLGAKIIRRFASRLFDQSAKCLIVDPDLRNRRAIKAYSKAGFTPVAEYPHNLGADSDSLDNGATLLMMLTANQY